MYRIATTTAAPPRLLEQLRQSALARYARAEPAERHVEWVRRFILFHAKRQPRESGACDEARYFEHLAQSEKDPLRSIEQAREALEFLYPECLPIDLGELSFPKPPQSLDRLRQILKSIDINFRERCRSPNPNRARAG
jgi:hypothetical protein